jgi:cytochrome c-type biogenesis protein CcmH/NrfG
MFSVYEITRPDEKGELQEFITPKPAPEEIARYETRLASQPDDAQAHFELASLLTRSSRISEAAAHYRDGLRLKPDSPEALNNLAWILATASNAALRNGPEAVQLAERACKLNGEKTASYLGTLAAGYAEAGRFDDAVSAATKAVAVAESSSQPELANINRRLLELYRARRAYHQQEGN